MKYRSLLKFDKNYIFVAVMLSILLALTFYAWRVTLDNIDATNQTRFESLAHESDRALDFRIKTYEQALLGGKGFFQGSSHVNRREWKAYSQSIDVLNNFPGISGIGKIDNVDDESLEAFQLSARADDYPHFTIHPKGDFQANFIITLIEPVETNAQAVGLNIAFEANRYEAATLSRDTGNAAITRRILLVQDAEKTPGFLLLLPMYQQDMPTETIEQRRQALTGWIYAPFIGKNFMQGLTSSQGDTLHLAVYDGTKESPDDLIFNSNVDASEARQPKYVIRKEVDILQQKWLLVWSSSTKFEELEKSNEPLLILVSGLLFTALFGAFMIVMLIGNSQKGSLTRNYYILPIAGFCIVLIGAYFLHERIALKETALVANATKIEANTIKENILRTVESRMLALNRMAERAGLRETMQQEEWRNDAKNYIGDQPGLKAVERIESNGQVRWIEPQETNLFAVGLTEQFLKNNIRENADGLKLPTITPPIDSPRGYKAFLSYSPIYLGERLDGYIVGLFGIKDTVLSSMPRAEDQYYDLRLQANGSTLFKSTNFNDPIDNQWIVEDTIELFGQPWTLTLSPNQQFLEENISFLPKLTLVIGIILAVMAGLIINFAQRFKNKSDLFAQHQNLLSTFVKHVPAAVAMFDEKMCYVAVSDRWYQDYRLSQPDVTGMSHYEVFPEIEQNHPDWVEQYQQAMKGAVIRVKEDIFVREDHEREWLRYELHPWKNVQNETGGIIVFTENITARKEMDIMKDGFISTVNHELRTPLTAIQASLGMLKAAWNNNADEKSTKLLDISYRNCERLTDLVNDILDMEKIAAGKMYYDFESTDISGLVEEIIVQNQSYADKYGVRYVPGKIQENLRVQVDKSRFNQALVNLLSNAAKFSPEGSQVTISVALARNHLVKISVSDNGAGIPADFHDKIFQRFAQADDSSTRHRHGTGLGLNITKSIIEAFGGTVNFEANPGGGTTFYFLLPISDGRKKLLDA